MTKTSTRSKRSTASDTAIKKNKHFKLGASPPELPELNHLFDLYWGGSERRITGLTLRIMGVNAIALVILMLGILYLGQYQNSLIEAKLETFKAEIDIISSAISDSAIQKRGNQLYLDEGRAKDMIKRLGRTARKEILLFNKNGDFIANSHQLIGPEGLIEMVMSTPQRQTLYSVQVLKNMTRFIFSLFPDTQVLPAYPQVISERAEDYPLAKEALSGQILLSAWAKEKKKGGVILSAAAPLHQSQNVAGVILITRDGKDIEDAIANLWMNIALIFLGTLFITTLLSIYLSGTIARPLRKLAAASEAVSTGKKGATEIPDLSARNDEIGELSLVLRNMTGALWSRMDSIESFAADVAHELKNPLTSLRSAIETAQIMKKKSDREKLFNIIMHDLERLDRLISDISNASRLDTELSRESFKPVDLINILDSVIDIHKHPLEREKEEGSYSGAAKIEDLKIKLDVKTGDKVYVWGLEGRLNQIFSNLLSNAISFSPPKGTIKINASVEGKKAIVTVEDQGPGIPDNKLDSIFERFYSERPEHEDYGQHSGLGLSICKQIIDAHSGEIFAENIKTRSGKTVGARFIVILRRT